MPCLITALTRSAIEKTTRKNNKQHKQKKNFIANTQYINMKASCNNVKINQMKP